MSVEAVMQRPRPEVTWKYQLQWQGLLDSEGGDNLPQLGPFQVSASAAYPIPPIVSPHATMYSEGPRWPCLLLLDQLHWKYWPNPHLQQYQHRRPTLHHKPQTVNKEDKEKKRSSRLTPRGYISKITTHQATTHAHSTWIVALLMLTTRASRISFSSWW